MQDDEPKKIGYARISGDQESDVQVDALVEFGVDRARIYTDRSRGVGFERPGLKAAIEACRKGDLLVICKLNRLGRSIYDVAVVLERLEKLDIKLVSLAEKLDARTPMGKSNIHTLAAMAQLERDLILERPVAGQEASRARGRIPGRRDKLTPEIEAKMLALLGEVPPIATSQIAKLMQADIGRTKFFNWMRANPDKVAAARKDIP